MFNFNLILDSRWTDVFFLPHSSCLWYIYCKNSSLLTGIVFYDLEQQRITCSTKFKWNIVIFFKPLWNNLFSIFGAESVWTHYLMWLCGAVLFSGAVFLPYLEIYCFCIYLFFSLWCLICIVEISNKPGLFTFDPWLWLTPALTQE